MKTDELRVVVVDDDPLSCEIIEDYLLKHFPEVKVAELCSNARAGIKAISKFKPDIIFLDIEMPGMSGFEMLKQLPVINFEIIFISAHDAYAINAIRFSALDYILKPVKHSMLKEAMDRALHKIQEKKFPSQYRLLLSSLENPNVNNLHSLAIPTIEGLVFIKLGHVIRCESENKYTKIYLIGKKMIMASKTLGEFEDLLKQSGFIRIHKSHLINTHHLKKYIKGEGGQVIMSDRAILPVARRKKEELLKVVSQFN